MISTYRHFKKHEELFLGLSFFTLFKLGLLVLSLVTIAFKFKLSPNSPLFLFVAIIWMIIAAVIVKADSGDEVKGFYTSFLTHPFKNHIFPLFASKEKTVKSIVDALPDWQYSWNPFSRKVQSIEKEINLPDFNEYSTKEGYKSLSHLQNIKEIKNELVVSKDGDLISYLKLDRGVAWSNLSKDERKRTIENWGRFLSQFQSISSMNSYFNTTNIVGDSVQAFVWAKRYGEEDAGKVKQMINDAVTNKHLEAPSIQLSNLYQNEWQQNVFDGDLFIPDLEFYLIIKHRRARSKIHPLYKLAKQFFPGWLPADLSVMTAEEYEEELNFLKQKIDVAQNALLSMDIKAKQMKGSELKDFCNYFMPISESLSYLAKQDEEGEKADIGDIVVKSLEDKSKYIKYQGKHYKTYRVHLPPEDGDLDAWMLNYFSMLETESYISVQWSPRDALVDRRKAERKADVMSQIAKSSKSSTMAIIKENKAISEELVAQPYSFDLTIYITIVCDSIDSLQKIDNRIRRPVHNAVLSPLDRLQVSNWLYSLPFAYNDLADREQLFATKKFAQSCFPFFKSEIGTAKGPLLGLSLEDMRPIFMDEYDRTVCNNRGVNFIGDSGSGKTVSAKLAVKRRFQRGGSFIIVDNTQDGWQFFMDLYGGVVVDIDTSISPDGRPFFAPLRLPEGYDRNQLNAQIERAAKLLTVIKERSTMLDAFEEVFLIKSLQELYKVYKHPVFSDLYEMWKSPSDILAEQFDEKYFSEWAELIAPYCRCTDGIYSGLMDGNNPRVPSDSKLLLFTFTKIDSNSNFLPVSLCLVANYVSQRVLLNKETGVTFVIDEAWKMFSGRNASKGKELMNYFARAGRGMDLGLWTISQKPNDLPREIHSSASASLTFQLKEAQDRRDMLSLANLTEAERSFLESPEMSESGTCLLKTTRSSGLLRVLLDPFEEILCNSTRDFVNKRNQIFERALNKLLSDELDASAITLERMRELRMQASITSIETLLKEAKANGTDEY